MLKCQNAFALQYLVAVQYLPFPWTQEFYQSTPDYTVALISLLQLTL